MSESTPSSSSALLTRLLQFDVNPVWVKDLRQASRSWTVTGTLLPVSYTHLTLPTKA